MKGTISDIQEDIFTRNKLRKDMFGYTLMFSVVFALVVIYAIVFAPQVFVGVVNYTMSVVLVVYGVLFCTYVFLLVVFLGKTSLLNQDVKGAITAIFCFQKDHELSFIDGFSRRERLYIKRLLKVKEENTLQQ